jgi:hypothetical protein
MLVIYLNDEALAAVVRGMNRGLPTVFANNRGKPWREHFVGERLRRLRVKLGAVTERLSANICH